MLERLADSRHPFLIGVRHHSPACAVRMPEWLESFKPEVILLELPPEFANWLSWLSHPETKAPVALAGADATDRLFFYPFADFSPELVALRWARERGSRSGRVAWQFARDWTGRHLRRGRR